MVGKLPWKLSKKRGSAYWRKATGSTAVACSGPKFQFQHITRTKSGRSQVTRVINDVTSNRTGQIVNLGWCVRHFRQRVNPKRLIRQLCEAWRSLISSLLFHFQSFALSSDGESLLVSLTIRREWSLIDSLKMANMSSVVFIIIIWETIIFIY